MRPGHHLRHGHHRHEALTWAAGQGLDVIVTDHHLPGETLPPATAIVTPRFLPPAHPLAGLPGVGVAYLLGRAVMEARGAGDAADSLDLVALGIVADVAPQRDDVRYLLQRGLEALRANRRPGLQALLESARVDASALNEETIGFALAPRINALGRLAHAQAAVDLFTTQDLGARPRPGRPDGGAERPAAAAVQPGYRRRTGATGARPRAAGRAGAGAGPRHLAGRRGGHRGGAAGGAFRPPGHRAHHAAGRAGAWLGAIRRWGGYQRGHRRPPRAAGLLRRPSHGRRAQPAGGPAARVPAGAEPHGGRDGGRARPRRRASRWMPTWDGTSPAWTWPRSWSAWRPLAPEIRSPCLVSRDLHVASATDMGRTGEHRRAMVADEHGMERPVIWWHGADTPVPDGQIDLAYSLRTRLYPRRDAAAGGVAGLPAGAAGCGCRSRGGQADRGSARRARPPEALRQVLASEPSPAIWAEVTPPAGLPQGALALDRRILAASAGLVVWTAPPGGREMGGGAGPGASGHRIPAGPGSRGGQPGRFLPRLAGLVKHALRAKGGRAEYADLAAAMGSREEAVRLGLQWLAAAGHVRIVDEDVTGFCLALAGAGETPTRRRPALLDEDCDALRRRLADLLAETAAYRRYFRQAKVAPMP